MPLTDAIIKATQHNPSCRIALTDGDGLQLRISTKDKRSWSLQYRFHGSMKKLTLGNWPNISCIKARKLANDARYAIARDIDPQEEKRQAKVQKLKLREVWEMYDQMHIAKNVKEKTAQDYRRNAAKDILPKIGKLNIDEIEKTVVVRLVDNVAKRAPVMANRTLGLLKHFFDWSVGRGHIDYQSGSGHTQSHQRGAQRAGFKPHLRCETSTLRQRGSLLQTGSSYSCSCSLGNGLG